MSVLERAARLPLDALEFSNVLLTTPDAAVGVTPREVVWSHREVTLYRYRSTQRRHAVPVLLVFALINRPAIFDLRPGGSFVEYLLEQGFDVFLLDWGVPDDEDADMGFEEYVCDELHWGIRETLRASAAQELTLLGWCMGGTMCAMYCGLESDARPRAKAADQTPVRNLALLTTPFDGRDTVYARLTDSDAFDAHRVADDWRSIPGAGIDFANKMLKPVTNYLTTYRRLAQDISDGKDRRESYQTMAKWVADNPPFPGRAWQQWLSWLYQDDALVGGRVRLRGRRVDLRRIEQNLLVVTAAGDHIAPRAGTVPIFELISSHDVTHLDRPGGHIGLIAGSRARQQIWPEITAWLADRSQP